MMRIIYLVIRLEYNDEVYLRHHHHRFSHGLSCDLVTNLNGSWVNECEIGDGSKALGVQQIDDSHLLISPSNKVSRLGTD